MGLLRIKKPSKECGVAHFLSCPLHRLERIEIIKDRFESF